MDEMKMKLRTKFMKDIVSRLIAKAIQKKYGFDIGVQLDDLDLSYVDGETKLTANVSVTLDSENFKQIVKNSI